MAVSRLVLYDKIGPGPHRCHWCGAGVAWVVGGPGIPDALLVDHLDWDDKNDAPENLVPSCNNCNARRAAPGKRGAIQPTELTLQVGKYKTRAVERTCPTCGSVFLSIPSKSRKFCSRDCSNAR